MSSKFKLGPIITILFIAIIFIATRYKISIEKLVLIIFIFIIVSFFILFETKEVDSKTLCILATLSAIGGVLRVPFAAIPGFQPVTFICAVTGYSLGSTNGFMVGVMCAFISNFFLGHGPWTFWQMMGWGLCGAFFGVSKKWIKKGGINVFILTCGLWGYIYGFILNQWYILEYMRPITLKAIFMGNILSFSHDTMHAISNVIFAKVFGRSFIEVLERFNRRNTVIRIESK